MTTRWVTRARRFARPRSRKRGEESGKTLSDRLLKWLPVAGAVIAVFALGTYRENNVQVAQISICSQLFQSLDDFGWLGLGHISAGSNGEPLTPDAIHTEQKYKEAYNRYFILKRNLASMRILMPQYVFPHLDNAGHRADAVMRTFAAGQFQRLTKEFADLDPAMRLLATDCRRVIRSEGWPAWMADLLKLAGRSDHKLLPHALPEQ